MDISKYKENLNEVLLEYQHLWDDWILSAFCFLTQQELKAIDYQILLLSNEEAADILQISAQTLSSRRHKALLKLRSFKRFYRQWLANKLFLETGILKKEPIIQFLQLPLYAHKLSNYSVNALFSLGDNLEEILMHDRKTIQNARGIGKRTMNELISLLKKNNYLHLLRD